MPRDPRLYLDDILEAIGQIQEYTASLDYGMFAQDRKTQDAVVRNLEIIGEAAGRCPCHSEARRGACPEPSRRACPEPSRREVSEERFFAPLRMTRYGRGGGSGCQTPDLRGLNRHLDPPLSREAW